MQNDLYLEPLEASKDSIFSFSWDSPDRSICFKKIKSKEIVY